MTSDSKIDPARRTRNITYAVRDVIALAEEAARGGMEMLYLNIGDPNKFDFQTPAHIVEATHRAMLDNRNGYAPSSGIAEAIDAVARQAARKGITNVQDIFITSGGSEAIDVCLTALVNPGENVLTPTPGYPLYTAVLNKLSAEANRYYLDESNGWQPDLDDIAAKINARTRGIILINPNNPTGSLCTRETLEGLTGLAREHGLVLFADEIYDKLLYDGAEHVSLASLAGDVAAVTFNGLSKSYLVPGFRIGWGIVSGPGDVVGDYVAAINKLLRARLSANHPEQYAIAAALEGDQGHLTDALARLTRRRDLTVEMLNSAEGISCVRPQGAFYAFPRLADDVDDDRFVKELIRRTGVVVVPGSGFGQAPGTHHFRVVFLPPEDVLTRAYGKIIAFLKQQRKGG